MYKKIVLTFVLLVIVFVSSGCDITQAQANTIANQATWMVSQDGLHIYGYIKYAGTWWDIDYVMYHGITDFGKANLDLILTRASDCIVNEYNYIDWYKIPDTIRWQLINHVMITIPLIPVAMFDILVFPFVEGTMPVFTVEEIPT